MPDQLVGALASVVARPGTRQLLRYVIAGFCVTQFAALIYALLAVYGHLNALEANLVSTACGVCAGYLAHNSWSFANGAAQDAYGKAARFTITTLLAFLFNSFWVWLLVSDLHLPALAPVPVMMFVTPWISFLANRYWVFRAA